MLAIRAYDCVFTTRYAYYNASYKENTRNLAKPLAIATNYLIDRLDLDKYPLVYLKPIVSNNYEDVLTYGYITPTGNIILDPKFRLKRLIKTISHEMCHVAQYQRGDLAYKTNKFGQFKGIIWKGKEYQRVKIVNERSLKEYDSQPWEVEANEFERYITPAVKRHVAKAMKCKSFLELDTEANS